MYGMLFQVVVRTAMLIEDQVIHRDEYLERIERKKEEYKNMSEYEKYKYNSRVAMKGCHS